MARDNTRLDRTEPLQTSREEMRRREQEHCQAQEVRPRNQIEDLEMHVQKLKAMLRERDEEILQLYRELHNHLAPWKQNNQY